MLAQIAARLEKQRLAGLARSRMARNGTPTDTVVAGREIINFASNDYLALAGDARVQAAACEGVRRFGAGAGGSALTCGYTDAHAQLECALAEFLGRDRALLFPAGYMANLAVISTFVSRGGRVYEDRLNHASLIDAAVLARAELHRFRHADVSALRRHSQVANPQPALLATDGVFSMDGDMAPLDELAMLAQERGMLFMVDDAHAIGVVGTSGGGCCDYFHLDQEAVPLLVGTLGKAFGSGGAFVAGKAMLIESLVQFARPYAYTTALAPALVTAALESLRILRSETTHREDLQQRIAYFRTRASACGIPLLPSLTPIQPLIIGAAEEAVRLSQELLARGLWVPAIRPPTVPKGAARLRVSLTAAHQEMHIDSLVSALAEIL